MTRDDAGTLEGTITIAQTLLRREKDKGEEITPMLISQKVEMAAALTDPDGFVDKAAATEELIRRFSHWVGKDATLKNNFNHVDWLNSERKCDWRYWHRLQRYLERRLSVEVVDALDRSTDGILELLEDPKRTGTWDRRGLVVGHVQSGKTSSYSALICKAADAGYKIIIVLAGMHNNLRSQTQIRLEEAFLGYETSPQREPGTPLGVFEEDSDPKIHPHCATTRADNGDFNASVARHFSISPEERPWLFVVKKNKSVLTKLLKWIQSPHVSDATDAATGRKMVTNLPLLVIDDEADHASVDTGEKPLNDDGTPNTEHEPKAINGLIRKILHAFSKSAYVGYTATPFANIFIHRRGETNEEGPDLFPQSFIKNIAAPSNYVGPARVFGLRGPDGRIGGLPLARDVSDHVSADGQAGWMPPKHKKTHDPFFAGGNVLPPSLREAIQSFALACAARVCRGQGDEHSSMLVHVTRYTEVQDKVRGQIDDFVTKMTRRITRGVDHEELVGQLRGIWERDFVPTCEKVAVEAPDAAGGSRVPAWDEILRALPTVLSDIIVKTVNGNAKDALDYVEHSEKGLKVIAIGGDKLARGLTLEGLCVSYFVRTTKMYDTLMQMGRWFGYRPGYLDLCRLYTTSELVQWFGHIADASEELREEFDTMVGMGATPWEYGMKVESHPVLLVTSPLKMRSAKTLSLSYSGSMVQTVSFFNTQEQLGQNLEAAEHLVAAMGAPSEVGPGRPRGDTVDEWKRSLLWNGVSSELVLDFLKAYQTPLGADRANSAVLAEFIGMMNEIGELKEWTIALLAEGRPGQPHMFSPHATISSFPSRGDNGVPGRYSIGVLTDPSDEAIDLGDAEWSLALAETLKEWKPDVARNRVTPPTRPSGKKVRELRGLGLNGSAPGSRRGLLMLYPLAPKIAGRAVTQDWDKPIMAFAISFPASQSGVKVDYKVDHLFWEQEYGAAD
ncbi:Z1 domain-containing protein [Crenobacter sp. SG2303]|uniref:Z1 domain-containing protein n=1 Tax=Crenobacter oryzisoli TaxID=3056844 RepID=A0ABT7XNX7_9NEIS|nr:Z1 domain-containing protein [Crenobacter sp. SG2303]MDN0075487.1 Z1 domain-containing protein [Crenobacter sp. SG2303]